MLNKHCYTSKILHYYSFLFSEQQLVDCDTTNKGCKGGWYTNAWYYFKYIAGGAAGQMFYDYTARVIVLIISVS